MLKKALFRIKQTQEYSKQQVYNVRLGNTFIIRIFSRLTLRKYMNDNLHYGSAAGLGNDTRPTGTQPRIHNRCSKMEIYHHGASHPEIKPSGRNYPQIATPAMDFLSSSPKGTRPAVKTIPEIKSSAMSTSQLVP